MVKLYCMLIIIKDRQFSKIPDVFKAQVEALLKEKGYDTEGNPLTTE